RPAARRAPPAPRGPREIQTRLTRRAELGVVGDAPAGGVRERERNRAPGCARAELHDRPATRRERQQLRQLLGARGRVKAEALAASTRLATGAQVEAGHATGQLSH